MANVGCVLGEVEIGRVASLFGLGSMHPTGEIPPLCLGRLFCHNQRRRLAVRRRRRAWVGA